MILALSASLVVAAAFLNPKAEAEQNLGFDPTRLQTMRDRMAQIIAEGRLHGIVTLIERGGKIVSLDAFGTRTVGGTEPMRTDTIFQIMSMTKPVAAVAAAILVERGQLRWNDTAADYVPAIGNLKLGNGVAPSSPIRIRHLLNHTSGISSDMPIDDDDRAALTLGQFVDRYIAVQPLRTEPGMEERYSGPGISLAGRIVEIVAKESLEAFCQKEIFGPLKMDDTAFFLPPAKATRLSGVGRRDGNRLIADTADPTRPGARFANPAGGLYSTAIDMARFQRAMLKRKGGLLSPATVDFMSTPSPSVPGSGEEHGFGMGFSIVRGPGPARNLLPAGSFGHSGAFGTYMWSDPVNDIVGVFMSQRLGGVDREIDLFRTLTYSALRK